MGGVSHAEISEVTLFGIVSLLDKFTNKTFIKIMAELKELAKAKPYFEGIYGELLNMEKSPKLGDIVGKISGFVLNEGKSMSTSQLRNIFARIKKADSPSDMQLLRPLLAYTSARQKGEGGKIIIALLDDLIQKANNKEQVKSLKTFAEAIVAYHKYHHPKQS